MSLIQDEVLPEQEITPIGFNESDCFTLNCKIKKLTPEIIDEINKYSHIVFTGDFNDDLTKKEGDKIVSIFTENVKFLKMNGAFNKPLDSLSSIETIYLETRIYSYPLDNLPNTLLGLQLSNPRESRIGTTKLKAITKKLPDNLEFFSLALRDLSNLQLEIFPKNLKIFHFYFYEYFFILPPLPESIEELKLFDATNYPFLNQYLPNLKKLICGHYFNLPLDNLPAGLESIIIRQLSMYQDSNFNQPLCKDGKSILPENLRELRLETNVMTHPIVAYPRNLKKLYLDVNCYCNLENLPDGLEDLSIVSGKHLRMDYSFDNLPSSLKRLRVEYCKCDKTFDFLPVNLEQLFLLTDPFTQPIDNLPIGLKYLDVNLDGNQTIYNLPKGLEYLRINTDTKYNQPIMNLPKNLKYLNCNNRFDSEIIELPDSLIWVKVGSHYTFINNLKSRYGDKLIIRPKRRHYDTGTYDSYTG